jgi:hypothetical protein
MYSWCYLVPHGTDDFYVYDHTDNTLMAEGYYIGTLGEGNCVVYVNASGLSVMECAECLTTTVEVTTTIGG